MTSVCSSVSRKTDAASGGGPISIVIPLYHEEENVRRLYERVCAACGEAGLEFELVLVDDGSRDRTPELLREIAAGDDRVKVLILQRNFGQTAAFAAGIDHATHPLIVTMDGDLQNEPADIPLLLEKLGEGYDVVSGWRKHRQDRMVSRRLPSMLANMLIGRVTGVRLHDYGCSLKLYRASILKRVRLYGELHRFVPALCSAQGARITEIPVRHYPRTAGRSKYGIGRTFRVILDLLTVKFLLSYATRPLHFFGTVAFFSFVAAFLTGALTLWMKFGPEQLSMNRNPLLYLTVFLGFVGVQFLAVGLIAELVMRTYFESQQKPVYVLRERHNLD